MIQKDKIIDSSTIDSTELEYVVSNISDKNKKLMQEIELLVRDANEKLFTDFQRRRYNLLSLLMDDPTKYKNLLSKLKDTSFTDKLQEKIRTAILNNKSLNSSQQANLQNWFKTQFESTSVKNEVKSKIKIDNTDVKFEGDKLDRTKITSLLTGILANDKFIKKISNRISSFQQIQYDRQFSMIQSDISRIFIDKRREIDAIQQNKTQLQNIKRQLRGRTRTIDDLYERNTRREYVKKYNKFVLRSFMGRITELKNHSADAIIRNVLSHSIPGKMMKFIKGMNPLTGLRKMKRIVSWSFWKNLMKKFGKGLLRKLIGLGNMIMMLPVRILLGTGKLSLKVGGVAVNLSISILSGLISLPGKIISGTYSLIKNILKVSIGLLKSSYNIGNGLLGKIKLFLMTPVGAYLTGFVVGFFVQKIKESFGLLIGKVQQLKEEFKKYLEETDENLRKRYPQYGKFMDTVQQTMQKIQLWTDENNSQFNGMFEDLKKYTNPESIIQKEQAAEDLKEKLNEKFGIGDISIKGQDILLLSGLKLSELGKMFEEDGIFGSIAKAYGQLKDTIADFEHIGGISQWATGKAANVGARLLMTAIGGAIGAFLGGNPISFGFGAAVGAFFGAISGRLIEHFISGIPESDTYQGTKIKSIEQEWRARNSQNGNSIFSRVLLTKSDQRFKKYRDLNGQVSKMEQEIKSFGTDESKYSEEQRKKKMEYEQKKKELQEIYSSDAERMIDSIFYDNKEQIDMFTDNLKFMREDREGTSLAFQNADRLFKYMTSDKQDIHSLYSGIEKIDISTITDEQTKDVAKKKSEFIHDYMENLISEYRDNNITLQTMRDLLVEKISQFDNTKIDVYTFNGRTYDGYNVKIGDFLSGRWKAKWKKNDHTTGLSANDFRNGWEKNNLAIDQFDKKVKRSVRGITERIYHDIENSQIQEELSQFLKGLNVTDKANIKRYISGIILQSGMFKEYGIDYADYQQIRFLVGGSLQELIKEIENYKNNKLDENRKKKGNPLAIAILRASIKGNYFQTLKDAQESERKIYEYIVENEEDLGVDPKLEILKIQNEKLQELSKRNEIARYQLDLVKKINDQKKNGNVSEISKPKDAAHAATEGRKESVNISGTE